MGAFLIFLASAIIIAAAVAIEKAKGQAESNRLVSENLTPELIQMKEAEARLKHGWVTVQGADAVATE